MRRPVLFVPSCSMGNDNARYPQRSCSWRRRSCRKVRAWVNAGRSCWWTLGFGRGGIHHSGWIPVPVVENGPATVRPKIILNAAERFLILLISRAQQSGPGHPSRRRERGLFDRGEAFGEYPEPQPGMEPSSRHERPRPFTSGRSTEANSSAQSPREPLTSAPQRTGFRLQ